MLLFLFMPFGTQANVSIKGKKQTIFHSHLEEIQKQHKPVTSDNDLLSWEDREEDEREEDEQIATPTFHKKFVSVYYCFQSAAVIPQVALPLDVYSYASGAFVYKAPSLSFLKTFRI
jgi:hypothetical protein